MTGGGLTLEDIIFMQTAKSNPCFRCGQERVVVKTWKEKVVNSIVIHTETICPDPDCQKVVDAQNTSLRQKRASAEEAKLKSEAERKLRIRQNLTLNKARA